MTMRAGWAVGFVLLSLPRVAFGQSEPPRINLRVYNGIAISGARMRDAERSVRTVLSAAGLETHWLECRPRAQDTPGASSQCDNPIQSDEITVRVLNATGAWVTLPPSLGFSYVNPHTRRGWLATAFADRIDALAGRLHINAGRLLGRTMVHEIGHLLLGTVEHAGTGIMQRQWSDLTILTGDFDRFLPDETVELHSGLVARSRQFPLSKGEMARLATVLVP
jgi:hypothetical protein